MNFFLGIFTFLIALPLVPQELMGLIYLESDGMKRRQNLLNLLCGVE